MDASYLLNLGRGQQYTKNPRIPSLYRTIVWHRPRNPLRQAKSTAVAADNYYAKLCAMLPNIASDFVGPPWPA